MPLSLLDWKTQNCWKRLSIIVNNRVSGDGIVYLAGGILDLAAGETHGSCALVRMYDGFFD